MDDTLRWIAEVTGARHVRLGERVQSLWSGYGEICRIQADERRLILKRVEPPRGKADLSHRRKCRSYDVEQTFYRQYALRCDAACRVPALVATRGRWLFLLEDLDPAGFAGRRRHPNRRELDACLAWLAAFHARFLGTPPDGLWPTGTYWHLATRPDELAKVHDAAIRARAPEWDAALRGATYRTLVHGDAKPANFCFGRDAVAAVDFQYVGGGPGIKDVAYLLHGTGVQPDGYLAMLVAAGAPSAAAAEWRELYPSAVLDFERFLAGWW